MSLYFFDTFDGKHWTLDQTGMECRDAEEAEQQAQSALPDMAHDQLPDGRSLTMQVRVRDHAGEIVMETILDLHTVNH